MKNLLHTPENLAEDEPDLTPMLDVVFIMLIFFIVTATFVKEIGLDLPADNKKPDSIDATKSLLVKIEKNDKFYVNRKFTERRILISYLSALHAQDPKATMVIMPDSEASTDSLVFVLDIGRILGVHTSISP